MIISDEEFVTLESHRLSDIGKREMIEMCKEHYVIVLGNLKEFKKNIIYSIEGLDDNNN